MTFKELYDIWNKDVLLRRAFVETSEMMKKDKRVFSLAFNALMQNINKDIMTVVEEEERIDEKMRDVRRKILEYLAVNSAPNVSASLVLTTIVLWLERIGDYSEDMTKLALRYPRKVNKKAYVKRFNSVYSKLLRLFDITEEAFRISDEEKARKAMRLYKKIKKECVEIFRKLESEKKMSPRTTVIYSLLTRYLQRVGALLNNINTTVVVPFPLAGSKKKIK